MCVEMRKMRVRQILVVLSLEAVHDSAELLARIRFRLDSRERYLDRNNDRCRSDVRKLIVRRD